VISTAPETFRRQMEHLFQNDYKTVSLKQLADDLTDKKTPPPKTVVLTFDDGFRNFLTEAFPVLEKYNFTATVFLVTDFCGKYNDWEGNPPALPRSKLLDWSEIKELSDYGIEFGSHTETHPDLTKISAEKIRAEITDSKSVIEDRLSEKVETFAYPYGRFNSESKRITAQNYGAACSTNLGKVGFDSDLLALERLDTYYLSNPKIFKRLTARSFDRYMTFRQTMRAVKSAFHSI
jgi:peptidoglycan/xylan/chitin deacetylase (PgdA/CDA1 family)